MKSPLPPVHQPELIIDHSQRITRRTHLARAGLLVERLREHTSPAIPPVRSSGGMNIAEPVLLPHSRRPGADKRQRKSHRLGLLTCLAEDGEVAGVVKEVEEDIRVLPRIARSEGDAAATAGPEKHGHDPESGLEFVGVECLPQLREKKGKGRCR